MIIHMNDSDGSTTAATVATAPLLLLSDGDNLTPGGGGGGGGGAVGTTSGGFDSSFSLPLAWLFLFCAILLEVGGSVCMKLADGFTRPLPSVLIFVGYIGSFILLPLSLKRIQLSTAYAVWSGLGTILTAIIGIVAFHDSVNWLKIVSLAAIVAGCVAIKFSDSLDEVE